MVPCINGPCSQVPYFNSRSLLVMQYVLEYCIYLVVYFCKYCSTLASLSVKLHVAIQLVSSAAS